MPAYFENFPLIRYGNTYARNITSRPGITAEVLKNSYVYYPYDIETEMRADLLSYHYYQDSLASWVFYLSNNIIDPFYQWYKSNEQVNNLIASKYGSLSEAVQRIKYWKVNWVGDDTILTTEQYNALTVNLTTGVNQKKYWQPIYNEQQIIGYRRKKLNMIVDTNRFIALDNIVYSSNTEYINDEKVYQTSGGAIIATGFVSFSSDNLILKNISGTFSNTMPVVGESSLAVSNFTSSKILSQNFPQQEASYWEPVSFYDYEIESNEQMKTINVIDANYLTNIQDNIKKVFK